MHTLRWLAGGLLATGLLTTGCGEGGEPPTRFNSRLGGADSGTPFGAGSIDAGILQDQREYKPAPVPNASGSSGAGSSVAAGSGDVQADVLALLDGVIKAALAGDIDALLDAFNAEQVAELKKDTSALIDTFTKVERLVRAIGSKLGKENLTLADLVKEGQTLAQSMNMPSLPLEAAAMFEVSVVDSENASVNVKIPGGFPQMMGSAAAAEANNNAGPPPMIVKKEASGWKIQLPKPISAEDVEQMKAGLKTANAFLEMVTDRVEASQVTSLPELVPVFMTAFAEYQAQLIRSAGEEPPGGGTPPETPTDAPSPGIIGPDGQPLNPRATGGGRAAPQNENENENENDNGSGNENENESENENENENENDNDGG